jgi:hypothetical protein
MGLYGFNKCFVPYIEDGSKHHTIRAPRVARDVRGNTMHLYTGLRQKGARLLGRFRCIKVEVIRITTLKQVYVDDVHLDYSECDSLAWADGFRHLDGNGGYTQERTGCFAMMMDFWEGRLPFIGDIYHWQFTKGGK